jgi:hypothetical protein
MSPIARTEQRAGAKWVKRVSAAVCLVPTVSGVSLVTI